MAVSPKFIVTGDKALDRALRTLEPRVARKVVRQAMRAAMKGMKTAIESTAPVGDTGALAASVKIRAGRRSRGKMSILVGLEDTTFQGERYYAAFVEYGTADMPGQGYMREALDTRGEIARQDAMRRIRDGIEREAAAAAKS